MASIASAAADAATKVYELYTDQSINPSTFSGAIDIVVVCHKDRKDLITLQRELSSESKSTDDEDDTKEINKNFLISTPFHVRFGKFQALRAEKVPVCIRVNNEINTDVAMRLNIQGIAEFIDPNLIDLSFVTTNDIIEESSPAPPIDPNATQSSADTTNSSTNTTNNDSNDTKIDVRPETTSTNTDTAPTDVADDAGTGQKDRVRKRDRLYNYLFGDAPESTEDNENNDNNNNNGSNLTVDNNNNNNNTQQRVGKRDRLWDFVKTSVQSGASYYYNDDDGDADIGNDNGINSDNDELEIIGTNGSNPNDLEKSPTPQTMSNVYNLYKRPVNNVPSSDMLHKLGLKEGLNKIEFLIPSAKTTDKIDEQTGIRILECQIFLWNQSNNLKVIISDIDGTITKSDARGQLFSAIGYDWMHEGIIELYNKIYNNGYKIVYLSARGIGQADQTRHYLFKMCSQQVNSEIWKFPPGPVLLSPTTTREALYREVIQRRPQDFKIPTLLHLFYAMTLQSETPSKGGDKKNDNDNDENSNGGAFFGGFGNRVTDVESYDGVSVNGKNIYIIAEDKERMERKAQRKNIVKANYIENYSQVTEKVDELFPPCV